MRRIAMAILTLILAVSFSNCAVPRTAGKVATGVTKGTVKAVTKTGKVAAKAGTKATAPLRNKE